MRNLLALVGLVVVLTGGLGWYLGWYRLGPDENGHRSVDVDTQKIKSDLKKGAQEVGDIIQNGQKQVDGTPTGGSNQGGFNVIPNVPTDGLPPPPAYTPIQSGGTPAAIPPPPSFPQSK